MTCQTDPRPVRLTSSFIGTVKTRRESPGEVTKVEHGMEEDMRVYSVAFGLVAGCTGVLYMTRVHDTCT